MKGKCFSYLSSPLFFVWEMLLYSSQLRLPDFGGNFLSQLFLSPFCWRVPALAGIWVLLRGPRESCGQLTSYLYSSCWPQPVLPWWNGFECKIFQLIPLLANIWVIVSFRLRNFWLISNPPPYRFFLSSFLIFHIVLLSEFIFSFLWNEFSCYNENVSFSLLGFRFLEGHDFSLSWSHF